MNKALLILAAVITLTLAAASPVDPVNKNKHGVAISGFDPVAYFAQDKPSSTSSGRASGSC